MGTFMVNSDIELGRKKKKERAAQKGMNKGKEKKSNLEGF